VRLPTSPGTSGSEHTDRARRQRAFPDTVHIHSFEAIEANVAVARSHAGPQVTVVHAGARASQSC
jgi:hypothetical protein